MKIDEFDFSPKAHAVINYEGFTEKDKHFISSIKEKYKYNGDLYNLLISLPNWVQLYNDVRRQSPRPKYAKELLFETAKLAEKLKACLQKFSPSMRSKMADKRLKKDTYKPLYDVEDNLAYITQKCRIEALRIPPDVGGIQRGSIPKDLLWYLIRKYEHATNEEVSVSWRDDLVKHVGGFYEFVLCINPLLKKMGIKLGAKTTIGTYVREMLTKRNEERSRYFGIILFFLTNYTCPSLYHSIVSEYFLNFSIFHLNELRSPRFNFDIT